MKSCTYSVHAEKNGKRVISIHKIHDNLPAAKKDAATLASMVPGAKGVVVKNGAARAVKRNTARKNPSDLDTALKVAAIISRKAGNKRGPIPKAGNPASMIKWMKWNDRDGDYRSLEWLTDDEVAAQFIEAVGTDDVDYWLKQNPANPPREVVLGHVVVHTKQGYTIPAYKKTFAKMREARKWLKAHVAREREAKANPGGASQSNAHLREILKLIRAHMSKTTKPHVWEEARERLIDYGVPLGRGMLNVEAMIETYLGKKTKPHVWEEAREHLLDLGIIGDAKANPACRCKTKNNPKCRCKR